MNRPRLLRRLATLAALVLLALPLVVALLAGLQDRRLPGDIGPGSGIVLVLVLAYLVWTPLIVIGLVWVLDHLGIHYTPPKREPRPSRKERKRTFAGLRFLAAGSTPMRPGARKPGARKAGAHKAGSNKAGAGEADARRSESAPAAPAPQGDGAGGEARPREDDEARPPDQGAEARPREAGADARPPEGER